VHEASRRRMKGDELVHCSVGNAAVLCEAIVKEEEEEEEEEDDEGDNDDDDDDDNDDFLVRYFTMIFSTTGCVVRHENTRIGMVGCYSGL